MPSPNTNTALIKALNVSSVYKTKGISIIGSHISAFLTDEDYLSLIKVSREFVRSYTKKKFRIEESLNACNSAKSFTKARPIGPNCYHTDVWSLSPDYFYCGALCSFPASILIAPIESTTGCLYTFINLITIPLDLACWQTMPIDQHKYDCAEGCYCMLCGPFLRRNMLTVKCCYGFAKGAAKDTCCNPYRPLDHSSYIGIFPPAVARNRMFKASLYMVRDENATELPGIPSPNNS